MGNGPILSVIRIVIIGTMLNFNIALFIKKKHNIGCVLIISDVYDLEGVTFHSQSVFYRNKPATIAFSAEVYNVKPDGTNIPAASGGNMNFALKVFHHSLPKTNKDK